MTLSPRPASPIFPMDPTAPLPLPQHPTSIMALRTPTALFLPLLLTFGACGGDAPTPDDDSVALALDEPNAAAPATPPDATLGGDTPSATDYRLTQSDLDAWIEVMRSPEQRAAMGNDDGAEETSLRAVIESNPQYRAAVERAGLTPARFDVISQVVILAMSANEVARAGMDGDSMARANGIDPVNVPVVAAREAELREVLGM